jgi:undecaprenyl-diphosphatase
VRGLLLLLLTTLPACVLGLVLHSTIRGLFSPLSVAAALAVGAVAMVAVESRAPRVRVWDVDAVSARDALWVGFWQCLALWPGFSRSAATIMGGMMLGFSRKVAAEYSFLAAVPVMVAATGYDLWKSREFLSLADVPLFSVGFMVAFVSACVAIRVFLHVVGSTSFRPFALYRLVVAAVVWGVWR